MTRERNDADADLHRFLATALQSHARDMFPDGTPVPPLHRSARGSAWPLVAVAAVVTTVVVGAVLVTASVLAPGAGTLTPAAGGIVMGPPCELAWADGVSRVHFTVEATGSQTWRVWEQDTPDRRFCLSIDAFGGRATETSAPRDIHHMLQGAALVSVDSRVYLWGLVTPAATQVEARDASGTWSASWTQPGLYALPSALGVFVTTADRADLPITVAAASSNGGPDEELVVTGK